MVRNETNLFDKMFLFLFHYYDDKFITNYVYQLKYTQHKIIEGDISYNLDIFIISHSPCLLSKIFMIVVLMSQSYITINSRALYWT